jgi:hypothetical protein
MMVHYRPQAFFTESSEKIFPAEWYFVTKLGPQVSPFPVPIFGVNKGIASLLQFLSCRFHAVHGFIDANIMQLWSLFVNFLSDFSIQNGSDLSRMKLFLSKVFGKASSEIAGGAGVRSSTKGALIINVYVCERISWYGWVMRAFCNVYI